MLDVLAHVVLSLALTHAGAFLLHLLVLLVLFLLVFFVFFTAKAVVYQVKEDPLADVGEFAGALVVDAVVAYEEFEHVSDSVEEVVGYEGLGCGLGGFEDGFGVLRDVFKGWDQVIVQF